jgi:hypothetical protein
MAKIVTYECNQCGCEITVSETHESCLMPIYCCGIEVSKVTPSRKKAGPVRKKAAKATAKKTAGKVVAEKSETKAAQKRTPPRKKISNR